MRWAPGAYLKYSDQRLRPALDLLARVPLESAKHITDLGCGAGTVVQPLAEAFPGALITGVDSSPDMLAVARETLGDAATWVQADAAVWQPDVPQDLIFSNAALHWLDHHDALFPRLIDCLAPGGVLAVQMPNQYGAPSHTLMRAVARDGPWADTLAPLLRPNPLASTFNYYGWLAPFSQTVDIWQHEYMQIMTGDDPVLDWISSTALKPLRDALAVDQRDAFTKALAHKLRTAYPKRTDGTTLFPFSRLFIVAVKT